jgi:glucosamine-phosphate N-acetyltransferase
MQFLIRELSEEDFVANSGLIETMANINDISHLSFAELKTIWQKACQQGSIFFVAISQEDEANKKIVATVKLLIESKFYHGGKSAGHIEDVVTRYGFEGQGLAKALLLTALQRAEKENCYKVILNCKKELTTFYEKVGLQEKDIGMRIDLK